MSVARRGATRSQPVCGARWSRARLSCASTGLRAAAFRWFERARAACGRAGIYAEEFDVRERQLRGNMPQAFVHALLMETAAALAADESGGG